VVIHFDSPFVAKFVRDENIESTSFVAGACFNVSELISIESSVVLAAVLFFVGLGYQWFLNGEYLVGCRLPILHG
jgi:hypothetical protein